MLLRLLGSLLRSGSSSDSSARVERRVLLVGGPGTSLPVPGHFRGWQHAFLCVESRGDPELACDARDLASLPPGQFDAVYCFHHLELHHRLDGVNVLRGFMHLLKPDGFAQLVVLHLQAVMQSIAGAKLDFRTVLYRSPVGPISVEDMIYGSGGEPVDPRAGRHAHKSEFTPQSLCETLTRAGFSDVHAFVAPADFEITAFAFKSAPTSEQRGLLKLRSP